jgi:hypothetical protein
MAHDMSAIDTRILDIAMNFDFNQLTTNYAIFSLCKYLGCNSVRFWENDW